MSNFPAESPFPPTRDFENDLPKTGNNGRCLLYGCAGIFLGGVFLILCGGFGAYYFFNQQLEKFTDTTPIDLPEVEYTDDQVAELEERIANFQEMVQPLDANPSDDLEQEAALPETAITELPDAAQPAMPRELVLTDDDLNALIAKDERTRGHLYLTIEDGTISGEVSAPLEGILPGGKGRYFNGSGTFDVRLDNGNLIVTLENAEVKGEPLPSQFITELRKTNLARDFNSDPQGSQFIEQFEKIDIEGDKIIITLKEPESPSEVTSDEPIVAGADQP
ncbi:hypothetical protein Pla22_43210 [Rubripirellula amarantea]|uniref:Uncharacterized protein n=1 Tax=Rubripirellula amarantea TaxID=2527999 RepID=A0A5C5WG95_9BACT|nr:hypothetical protein [Rubripirellula amarantea]TWT49129.1 hypothetical protein Pla22_43210 [Rubripirellula amarantea]